MTSGNVVLFLPPYAGRLIGPPLGLLSLAGAIRDAGYKPVIIDGALDLDFEATIAHEIRDCLCFGVSLLTGPMIADAIRVSKLIRRLRPELPIIYGGWHPSLMSQQTLEEDYVDIVVRHQGEQTLVEILRRLERGQPLDLVAGCWFKRNGRQEQNPDRPAAPIADLPRPAYDMVDWPAYQKFSGNRTLPYGTSIGCPYACNYCTDTVFYNRRFNPYSAERVVEELAELAREYRLDEIALIDSNFLVDVHRAMTIARGIHRAGVRYRWSFQASTDLLCRLSDEDVELLAHSGVSHIGFGTESASPEILHKMQKGHQSVPDMYEAARKCSRVGIRVTFNLIFGYPGEEESHRRETLRVMGEIADRFETVGLSPNVFTAYPGIPIWPELRELGVREPQSLAEWAGVDLGQNRLPWLQGNSFAMLQRGISYLLLDNQINKARRSSRSALLKRALELSRRSLLWRIRNHCFSWPFELQLAMTTEWLSIRRSLLTGTPLSRTLSRSA